MSVNDKFKAYNFTRNRKDQPDRNQKFDILQIEEIKDFQFKSDRALKGTWSAKNSILKKNNKQKWLWFDL